MESLWQTLWKGLFLRGTDTSITSDLDGMTLLLFDQAHQFRSLMSNGTAGNDDDGYNGATDTSHFNTSSGGAGNGSTRGQDTYEFVAFVLWYLFLVLCCVVPTCCAYRRRRLVEARLAQHQYDLQRLHHQQQQQHYAMAGGSSFFILDQLSSARRNSENVRRLRTEKIGENLKETTLKVSDKDFVQALSLDLEKGAEVHQTLPGDSSGLYTVEEDIESENAARVRLPDSATNANRTVPGFCAICLCPYESGDQLTWSPKSACQHAFHTDCIVPWLAKKDEQKCPVCRQDFCQPVQVEDEFLQHHHHPDDLFLDSFALALNYARSQAVRSWAEEVRGSPFFHHDSQTSSSNGTSTTVTATPHSSVPAVATAVTNNNNGIGHNNNTNEIETHENAEESQTVEMTRISMPSSREEDEIRVNVTSQPPVAPSREAQVEMPSSGDAQGEMSSPSLGAPGHIDGSNDSIDRGGTTAAATTAVATASDNS